MKDTLAVPSQVRRSVRGLPDRRAAQARPLHGNASDHHRLRDISEFSTTYESRKRKSMFLASLLMFFSASCLGLFLLDIKIVAVFGIGSLLILMQLLHCGYELFEEGARIQRAYHVYLAGFPPQLLTQLRYSNKLSDWTKYEIEKFIASFY